MRKIKELIGIDKKVYILLKTNAIRFRFMSDAELEGITYGDGAKTNERLVDDIMSLQQDGTICCLGWAGRMCYHDSSNAVSRVDYEKYITDSEDYIISLR